MSFPSVHGGGGHAFAHASPTQCKRTSLVEAVANTMVGYGVALGAQLTVFPAMGMQVTLQQNLAIGAIFMGISTARSYLLRRLFEWLRLSGVIA